MRFSVALLVRATLIAACAEHDDEAAAPSGSLADLTVEVDPGGPDHEKAELAPLLEAAR